MEWAQDFFRLALTVSERRRLPQRDRRRFCLLVRDCMVDLKARRRSRLRFGDNRLGGHRHPPSFPHAGRARFPTAHPRLDIAWIITDESMARLYSIEVHVKASENAKSAFQGRLTVYNPALPRSD